MSRAVLAVMAGLLCTLAGFKYASTLKGDAVRLGRWVQLLDHLALLLREGMMSIPEALLAAADGPHPPDMLLRDVSARMQSAPMTTPEEAFLQCSGDRVEKALLQRMFGRLGRGSQDSRCLAVEQAAQEMRQLAQSAASTAEKDVKLWQTLGLLGGACLTILLL